MNDVAKSVVAPAYVTEDDLYLAKVANESVNPFKRDSTGKFVKRGEEGYSVVRILAVLFVLGLAGWLLVGCAAISQTGSYICNHRETVRINAENALMNAQLIQDAGQRTVAIAAAQSVLAALESCPPVALPTEGVY